MDVTEIEPLPLDSPLRQLDNVFLTPHLAGLTTEARQQALSFAAENANTPRSVAYASFGSSVLLSLYKPLMARHSK